MRFGRSTLSVVVTFMLVTLAGCAWVKGSKHDRKHKNMKMEKPTQAVAVIQPTEGHAVEGFVAFKQVDEGVRVQAEIEGLESGQKYGFHIHEYGDIIAPDGTSAGGHYDPENTGHHARPNAEEPHHAGDLGNLEGGAYGQATYDRVIENISVAGHPNPIIGRAVVIHGQPDDFGQPTGNAGPRIGIGVIGVTSPDGG